MSFEIVENVAEATKEGSSKVFQILTNKKLLVGTGVVAFLTVLFLKKNNGSGDRVGTLSSSPEPTQDYGAIMSQVATKMNEQNQALVEKISTLETNAQDSDRKIVEYMNENKTADQEKISSLTTQIQSTNQSLSQSIRDLQSTLLNQIQDKLVNSPYSVANTQPQVVVIQQPTTSQSSSSSQKTTTSTKTSTPTLPANVPSNASIRSGIDVPFTNPAWSYQKLDNGKYAVWKK